MGEKCVQQSPTHCDHPAGVSYPENYIILQFGVCPKDMVGRGEVPCARAAAPGSPNSTDTSLASPLLRYLAKASSLCFQKQGFSHLQAAMKVIFS